MRGAFLRYHSRGRRCTAFSLTGKGHHTDIAIIMGLAGNLPDTVDIDAIRRLSRM
ncbi:serine dehydratase beta chain [Shigella flexneri]